MYQYLYLLVCIKSPESKYYALRDVSAIDFSLSFCTIIPILLVVEGVKGGTIFSINKS